jgi:tRNA (cytidine/uridine-2'-O-)-methyltransferase
VALSARAEATHWDFRFEPDDWLLFGRESDGLPARSLAEADVCLTIPMTTPDDRQGGACVRSLNLSVAVGIVLFEAMRQLRRQAQQLI